MLVTKFCTSAYGDIMLLGLALFWPAWIRVSKTLVFLAARRNLILMGSSLKFLFLNVLVMLSILSNADHILEVKLSAIIFWHLILYILVCSTL